jgi:multidrug transporter EmrE-like cation transporter
MNDKLYLLINIVSFNDIIMNIETLSWSLSAAFISTTYFFLIKYYTQHNDNRILASIISLELLVIFLYYKSLQYTRSGTICAIINGFSILLGASIAVVFFDETLTSVNIVGIIIIIIGIVLVSKK